MSRRRSLLVMSEMSEEEISEMMDSISSAEDTGDESNGDFDSDDDIADPNFHFSEDDLLLDDIPSPSSRETDASLVISNLNIIQADPIAASSPLPSIAEHRTTITHATSADELPTFDSSSVDDVPTSDASSIDPDQPRSRLRKRKRAIDTVELIEEQDGPNILSTGQFNGVVNGMRNDSEEFRSIIWKKKNMQVLYGVRKQYKECELFLLFQLSQVHVNEIVYRGQPAMSEQLKALKSPLDCFKHFLNEEIMQHLADQTNLYAHQKNVGTRFVTNAQEIRKFIGIMFFMSVYRLYVCIPKRPFLLGEKCVYTDQKHNDSETV